MNFYFYTVGKYLKRSLYTICVCYYFNKRCGNAPVRENNTRMITGINIKFN